MRSKHKFTVRKNSVALPATRFLLLSFLLIFSSSISGMAQEKTDHPEYQYLFKNDSQANLRFSTFYGEIAPSTAWANLNSSFGNIFLMEFGIHLNRKFAVGFYSARSPKKNQVLVPQTGTPEYDAWLDAGIKIDQLPPGSEVAFVYFTHSGINLAYMHNTEKVMFYRAGIRVGSGKLEMLQNHRQVFDFFNTSIYEAKAFNVNPEIGVGINLRSWWRLHADVGYRIVIAQADRPINPTNFYGLTFKVGFAFGAFNN